MSQAEKGPYHNEASMAGYAAGMEYGRERSDLFRALGAIVLAHENGEAHELSSLVSDDLDNIDAQRSREEQEKVKYIENLLEGYAPFDADVQRIKAQLETLPAREVEGFLASGNESDVFIVGNDGESCALRISKSSKEGAYSSASHINSYLEGAFRAAHIDGMEKLKAISYKEGVTIGELIRGEPMAEHSAEAIAAIPEEHYKKLATTVVEAAQAGIAQDGNEGNLLYGESGFKFVDVGIYTDQTENRAFAYSTTTAVFGTDTWLPSGKIPASEHEADYIVLRDVLAATIPTYDRWINMLYEAQEEAGVGSDYLTLMENIQQTAVNMKAALEELIPDGAVQELVRKSQLDREVAVRTLQRKIEKEDNSFIRANIEKRLERRMQVPDRIFPKGSVRPSRND